MGHWVELMKLDTTSEQLMNIAKRDYGEEYQMQMEQELNMCADDNARNEYVSSKAK